MKEKNKEFQKVKKAVFIRISQKGTVNPVLLFNMSANEISMQTRLITGENIQPSIADNSTNGCGITLSAFV